MALLQQFFVEILLLDDWQKISAYFHQAIAESGSALSGELFLLVVTLSSFELCWAPFNLEMSPRLGFWLDPWGACPRDRRHPPRLPHWLHSISGEDDDGDGDGDGDDRS